MNILITGSSGMLGQALCGVLKNGHHRVTGVDLTKPSLSIPRPETFTKCDITDYPRLNKAVKKAKPDMIIHAAAITDVDGCELRPGKAEAINAAGTRYIAEAAFEAKAGLIYVSTDFVFNGEKKSPYTEDDTPDPINVYGKSKLDGEKFAADIIKDGLFIVRSSWMFGNGGRNFVDRIIEKARKEKSIRVVSDQFGSPTYAVDLAWAINKLLESSNKKGLGGIYHITNSDDCSWYRLAQKILTFSNIYNIELVPIVSEELDLAADRPTMSILDNGRYEKLSGAPLRRWDRALEEYLASRDKKR